MAAFEVINGVSSNGASPPIKNIKTLAFCAAQVLCKEDPMARLGNENEVETTMKTTAWLVQPWMLCAALLSAGILGGTKAQAQSAVQAWVQRYNGAAETGDRAHRIVVDTSGNVIVVGYSDDLRNRDWLILKYSGAGLPLWTNRYNGPGNSDDQAKAVAVDGTGNVFVAGTSVGSDSYGAHDYATIAYSGTGVPLWTNRYNGPGQNDDQAHAVTVDNTGDVYVTGFSYGAGTGNDFATIKYSGAGVPLWTNRYHGPGNGYDKAAAVAVDGDGNVFVTGLSYGSGSSYDYATIKYSGAGVPVWTSRFSGPGNHEDYPHAVALDGNGNVFVTGD